MEFATFFTYDSKNTGSGERASESVFGSNQTAAYL